MSLQQDIGGHLREAAVATYGEETVRQPAMEAALANIAAALRRIRQEQLEPTGPAPNG